MLALADEDADAAAGSWWRAQLRSARGRRPWWPLPAWRWRGGAVRAKHQADSDRTLGSQPREEIPGGPRPDRARDNVKVRAGDRRYFGNKPVQRRCRGHPARNGGLTNRSNWLCPSGLQLDPRSGHGRGGSDGPGWGSRRRDDRAIDVSASQYECSLNQPSLCGVRKIDGGDRVE